MAYVKTENIVVVRMDDVVYTYSDATFTINNNVLIITQYRQPAGLARAVHRHPLFNVWDWYPDGQDGG